MIMKMIKVEVIMTTDLMRGQMTTTMVMMIIVIDNMGWMKKKLHKYSVFMKPRGQLISSHEFIN